MINGPETSDFSWIGPDEWPNKTNRHMTARFHTAGIGHIYQESDEYDDGQRLPTIHIQPVWVPEHGTVQTAYDRAKSDIGGSHRAGAWGSFKPQEGGHKYWIYQVHHQFCDLKRNNK